jgi:hypothetical protein
MQGKSRCILMNVVIFFLKYSGSGCMHVSEATSDATTN